MIFHNINSRTIYNNYIVFYKLLLLFFPHCRMILKKKIKIFEEGV